MPYRTIPYHTVPYHTHVKISQLVASLQTSCQQVVFARLVTSCQQVWNKLLTTCNNLVDIIRLVTRLFQQDCYNHDITIFLQLCLVNLATFLLYHDCTRLVHELFRGGGGVKILREGVKPAKVPTSPLLPSITGYTMLQRSMLYHTISYSTTETKSVHSGRLGTQRWFGRETLLHVEKTKENLGQEKQEKKFGQ